MTTMIASGALGLSLYFLYVWLEPNTASPPIAVTGMSIDPKPYEVGKTLHVYLRINNVSSGLKLKGGFKTWAGAMDEIGLRPENRQSNEALLWKEFESSPPVQKFPLSWVRGDTISVCDGPTLTQEQADRLNGANGIVYMIGQIDYGDGALDFGGYIRTANPQVGTFAIEHNGPAEKRFFETKQP